VELLEASVKLARRSITFNGVAHRVDLRLGDLRDESVLGPEARFDLITANPPYSSPGSGPLPRHPQRGAARFELNGNVFDYCRVAARHLAPGGRLCFCYPCRDSRAEDAIEAAGLVLLSTRRVVFRQGRPHQLALHVFADPRERPPGPAAPRAPGGKKLPDICVRDEKGQRTPGYLAVLRDIGIIE
jgi:tRNA1(Val) A37 N6-methylase TrmN6